MRSQAAIFVIGLIIFCVSAHRRPCKEQADCRERGTRCVFRAGKDLIFACEILSDDNMKSKCRCLKGCLKCDGGADLGTSRFIRPRQSITVGCGLNTCSCTNPNRNQIACTDAACDEPAWTEHCEDESP